MRQWFLRLARLGKDSEPEAATLRQAFRNAMAKGFKPEHAKRAHGFADKALLTAAGLFRSRSDDLNNAKKLAELIIWQCRMTKAQGTLGFTLQLQAGIMADVLIEMGELQEKDKKPFVECAFAGFGCVDDYRRDAILTGKEVRPPCETWEYAA